MILEDQLDIDGKPIDTEKVYVDEVNTVSDIHIVQDDGKWYAKPDGLDEEELASVVEGLREQ